MSSDARDKSNIIYEDGYVVSTFAGTGEKGYDDCAKEEAAFHDPRSVAVDFHGNIYVTEFFGNRLRKITIADGAVHTAAGTGEKGCKDGPADQAQFSGPCGMAIVENGDVIIAEDNRIRVFSPTLETVKTIDCCKTATFDPYGIATTANGTVFASDIGNNCIVKICTHKGLFDTVVGTGQPGHTDGEPRQSEFNGPCGIAVSPEGDIYIADSDNNSIRKINAMTGVVSTVAGTGVKGWGDGDAREAKFDDPSDIVLDADGCAYISDCGNHSIRKFDPTNGRVVTVAGTGEKGWRDEEGSKAELNTPCGLALGHDGVLYVADRNNHCIRAITRVNKEAAELSENEFKDLESKLKKKTRYVKILAKEIHSITASTVAAWSSVETTKNATVETNKALAETQNALKVKHVELRSVLEQRKADLKVVEDEVTKMQSTKAKRVAELDSAKVELSKSQAALEKAMSEKSKYDQKLERAEALLVRTRARNDVEQSSSDAASVDAGECTRKHLQKPNQTTMTLPMLLSWRQTSGKGKGAGKKCGRLKRS